jgi:acylphosphatase
VRNEADGSVTALMVGSDAAVSAMLENLWKGPPGAMVSSVTSEEKIDTGEGAAAFRITG